MLTKHKVVVDTTVLANGDSLAAYLTSAAGTLLTHTTIGAKEHLDTKGAADVLDSVAYQTGVDYLTGIGVVNNAGDWVPFTLNAAGELPVAATVNFAGDYAEDSAHASGDVGLFSLAVRRDTRSSGTSADGDYGSFNVNSVGELWVKDADVLAALTAFSKAEDAAHSSGDTGIHALAVRKDAQGTNTSADGDYASLLTWSEGSLKTVDIRNATVLNTPVAVATTATALPTAALANRKELTVQNVGNASIWVGSATVTTSGATRGTEIPKGGSATFKIGPAVALYGICAAGTVETNILELA